MDIFKFSPITGPINLVNGDMIHGINTVMWVERYRDSGEFTITADVDSNIRAEIPIGTLISHMRSRDVMIVENHEISDAKGEDLEVTITGRSLETILEQRVVGQNRPWPSNYAVAPFPIDPKYTWVQVVDLIKVHTDSTQVPDINDALQGIITKHTITRTDGEQIAREIKLGTDLYSAIVEIMAIEKLGIRAVRPSGAGNTATTFEIHEGRNLSSQIIFSFDAGDITNVDYLWSNKGDKNSIMIIGKWVQELIKSNSPNYGYNRRVTMIDASDIDDAYQNQPTTPEMDVIRQKLRVRGDQALKAMNSIALSKAQAAKNSKKYVYREDFEVGDIVLIDGLFNESAPMRIIEYVEISDKDGVSGYPTLSTWPEES